MIRAGPRAWAIQLQPYPCGLARNALSGRRRPPLCKKVNLHPVSQISMLINEFLCGKSRIPDRQTGVQEQLYERPFGAIFHRGG
jgi:hypothetical protein